MSHMSAVETYNPKTDKWTYISPLNVARFRAGVCISGGKIYVVGGCVGLSAVLKINFIKCIKHRDLNLF